MHARGEVDHLRTRNERLDVLHPLLVGRILLEIIYTVLVVVEFANVSVRHAVLQDIRPISGLVVPDDSLLGLRDCC